MPVTQEDIALIRWVQCEYVHCHSRWCQKCTDRGGAHGPYWRGYYKLGNRTRSIYLGRELPPELEHLTQTGRQAAKRVVPKSTPRPSAARQTPPAVERPAYLLGEAEGMLGLRPGYNRETLRKKLWNKLALKSCTQERANELLACANVILKWHGWTAFTRMPNSKHETQSQAH